MKNPDSIKALIYTILITIILLLAFAFGPANAQTDKLEPEKKSILINKDGSITIAKELWEQHAKALLKQDALMTEVAIENEELRNKLKALMASKCVGLK